MTTNELIQQIDTLASQEDYLKIVTALDKYLLTQEVEDKLKQVFSEIDDDQVIAELARKMISGPSSETGVFAALALACIKKPKVIPHLADALISGGGFGSSINAVRLNQEVTEILKEYGELSVEPLLLEVEKHMVSINFRNYVLKILYEITTEESIPLLGKYLEYKCMAVREIAAATLKYLEWEPGDQQQEILFSIATHSDDKLIEIGKPALEEITKALQYAKEANSYPHASLVRAAGEIGDRKPVDLLIELLGSNYRASRVPGEIVRALGKIGDERGIIPICEHIKNAKLLQRAKPRTYADALISLAKDHEGEVKRALNEETRRMKKIKKIVRKEIHIT